MPSSIKSFKTYQAIVSKIIFDNDGLKLLSVKNIDVLANLKTRMEDVRKRNMDLREKMKGLSEKSDELLGKASN